MDDQLKIECVERIHHSLLHAQPRLSERLEVLRKVDYRDANNDVIRQRLLAVLAGINDCSAEGKRQLRRRVAAVGGASAGPAHVLSNHVCEDDTLGDLFPGVDSARFATSMRVFESHHAKRNSNYFAAQLAGMNNAYAAAAQTRRWFPVLTDLQAYEFLSAVGYPATVPASPTIRLVSRLLNSNRPGKPAEDRRLHLADMECFARLSGRSAPELDLIFGLHAGARHERGIAAVCTPTPLCHRCCVSSICGNVRQNGMPPEPLPSRTMKALPCDQRPRERLLQGAELSDHELLAVILRTGTRQHRATELASRLLEKFETLQRLEAASPAELRQVDGIGPAKAAEIMAAIELGRRFAGADGRNELTQISCSSDVFRVLAPRFRSRSQEEFVLMCLNTRNRITRTVSVSIGTLNSSIVHPRDVFRHAIAESAAGVIFAHNHPSGDPAPSAEDRALTSRLREAGKLLGIKVLDHVIIGANRHYSFADEGELS